MALSPKPVQTTRSNTPLESREYRQHLLQDLGTPCGVSTHPWLQSLSGGVTGIGHTQHLAPAAKEGAQAEPRAYLLKVPDLVLSAIGSQEGWLLPRQRDAPLLHSVRADVGDGSGSWKCRKETGRD